ncbi:MAG: 7-cyano-7-deazaguanine synthase QueC [Pseudomonadota bacterium]
MKTPPENSRALVMFSGGQDSTVCLAWALSRYAAVETVGFNYGQRHSVELECRLRIRALLKSQFADWAPRLGPDHLLDANGLRDVGETAMTHETEIEMSAAGLPNTFVPGRNLIFAVLASAVAYRRAIPVLVGGMCETDFSGYPDCRRETLDAQMRAVFLGMEYPITLKTPLMELNKAETWALGESLGGPALTKIIIEESHTCYKGNREDHHPWGFGCAACPACDLRAQGFSRWTAAPA